MGLIPRFISTRKLKELYKVEGDGLRIQLLQFAINKNKMLCSFFRLNRTKLTLLAITLLARTTDVIRLSFRQVYPLVF